MRILVFLIVGMGIATPSRSQHLSDCDWKSILSDSQVLINELEMSLLQLGDSVRSFQEKEDIIDDASQLFDRKAQVRSDIERNTATGQIRRTPRSGPPKTYLNNARLFYTSLEIEYEDLQVSYLENGKRIGGNPELIYEFRRVLNGKDIDGIRYSDVVDRKVSFKIRKQQGEWTPFIQLLDYDEERFPVEEAQRKITAVNNGCTNEQLDSLAREEAAKEEEIARVEAEAEGKKSRIQDDETITDTQKDVAIAEVEETTQQELEAKERTLQDIQRKKAREEKKLRIQSRRKRLFAPTLYLGVYSINQGAVALADGDSQSKMFSTIGGGVDLAYLKADFNLTTKDEALSSTSLADNGFPSTETATADSVSLLTGSVIAGMPLMIGKEFVLFAGGGGMYTHYAFSDGGDEIVDILREIVPIAQASFTWVLPERGGGISLFYRRSFGSSVGSDQEDASVIGVGFHYYPTKKR